MTQDNVIDIDWGSIKYSEARYIICTSYWVWQGGLSICVFLAALLFVFLLIDNLARQFFLIAILKSLFATIIGLIFITYISALIIKLAKPNRHEICLFRLLTQNEEEGYNMGICFDGKVVHLKDPVTKKEVYALPVNSIYTGNNLDTAEVIRKQLQEKTGLPFFHFQGGVHIY